MLRAERLGIQPGIGDGCGGRRRLQGGEGAKAAGGLARLLLRPRNGCPERQEGKHKDDADAHDSLPATTRPSIVPGACLALRWLRVLLVIRLEPSHTSIERLF